MSAHVNASVDLNSLKSSFVRTLASRKKLNRTRLQTKNNCVEFLICLILEHFPKAFPLKAFCHKLFPGKLYCITKLELFSRFHLNSCSTGTCRNHNYFPPLFELLKAVQSSFKLGTASADVDLDELWHHEDGSGSDSARERYSTASEGYTN